MKKHVEVEHKTLFAKYVEHVANHIRYLTHWEPSSKNSLLQQMQSLVFFILFIYLEWNMANKNVNSWNMSC